MHIYYYCVGGGLLILRNGKVGGSGIYRSDAIEKRLLEVYVDTKRTVSPELVKCVQDHISKVN
jgi:hypothetical protein